jgi:hypothetical protein
LQFFAKAELSVGGEIKEFLAARISSSNASVSPYLWMDVFGTVVLGATVARSPINAIGTINLNATAAATGR